MLEAEDGRSGLEVARRERPDLVLTDLALPGLSGLDLVRLLKADSETASIPIVALTAHTMRGDRERALASGCDGFIAKPLDDEQFPATIRAFLTRHEDARARSSPEDSAATAPTREPSTRSVDAPARARPAEQGPRRVLVVDDNPNLLRLMRQYLEPAGFAVLEAADGASALDCIERDAPDLVILDVMLPGLDGYEITQRIKNRPSAAFLPVVLVTAGSLDRERGLEAGADDFLGKPIDRGELLVRVRSLIRLRDAVEEARRQAEALRRLDQSKQRLIAAVAHDLRTPLNAMSLIVDAVRLAPPPLEELAADLAILSQNIRQMDQLLTTLLDYSKAVAGEQPLQLSRFDPRDLAVEVGESFAAMAAHRGLELREEFDPALPSEVVSDYLKCRQVIFNLVSNALKYTERGTVLIRMRPCGSGGWAVDVQDTGVGLSPDDTERIFEEFEQAKVGRPADAPGTGLGLAICRHLVNRLGGTLTVESQIGQGSTFTVHWPSRPPETAGENSPSETP